MRDTMEDLEVVGWTPESVMKLGNEWIESIIKTAPADVIIRLSGAKLEPYLAEGRAKSHKEGRQEEAATMLLKQMRRKFGQIPNQVTQKIQSANLEVIEEWGENILFANSLEDVLASR